MRTLVIWVLASVVLVSCGGEKGGSGNTLSTPNPQKGEVEERAETEGSTALEGASAICLWKELSLRQEAGAEGKWMTTILLGEKMDYTGESETLTEKEKEITYHQMVLGDGTKGWVRSEFVALDALRGAFVESSKIYKRPDILTGTDTEFDEMDFVAILSERDDWYEIKSKRPTDKWFVSGYVKKEKVSIKDVDVAFSILYQKAINQSDETKKEEALKALSEESDLSTSVFSSKLKDQLSDLAGYDFFVNAYTSCQVGMVKMADFDKNRNWEDHWKNLEPEYTPVAYEGIAKGRYTLILKADSTVAIKHIMVDGIDNGKEYFVEDSEFK